MLVIRRSAPRVVALARRRGGIAIVTVDDAGTGLSASLRAGLRALRPIEREAWLFLADMPAATAPRALRLMAGDAAVRPYVGDIPGHPLLVRIAAARSLVLEGDRGLNGLRTRRWRGVPGNVMDVDDRATWLRWRARFR